MKLAPRQFREIYEGLVLALGHPDPIGYVTRAFIMSGGDDAYYDAEGRVGFMPVDPARVQTMVGTQNVASLRDNVAATVTMDLMFFQQFGTIEDMIVAFHFGEDRVNEVGDGYKGDIKAFLDEVDNGRGAMREIVSPRRATVEDVLKMAKASMEGSNKPNKLVLDVVNRILEDK